MINMIHGGLRSRFTKPRPGVPMGALTAFLQQEFNRKCPAGWLCHPEQALLPPQLASLLGYQARGDILLAKTDGTRRLWIEFEVSRADPVANHAKFATSHLFEPQRSTDCFLAMVSPHVTPGRRNLAANAIGLMRQVGMRAFQTTLFPHHPPSEIQRLNHLTVAALALAGLPVEQEIERALYVSEPSATVPDYAIHPVGDLIDVYLNLLQWNQELATEKGKQSWGRRVVTYFVHQPGSKRFAPSKFCGYSAILESRTASSLPIGAGLGRMTVGVYARLNDGAHVMDGNRAQVHLTTRLGMLARSAREAPEVNRAFEVWVQSHSETVQVHPKGPVFLLPPPWFTSAG
jgi:hypothetical protein